MSSKTSRSTSATPFLREHPDALKLTGQQPRSPRRGFWPLVLVTAAFTAASVALGAYLFAFAPKSIAPPPGRKIEVPYANDAALLAKFHGWVVQEDGRNKPFDTFARETVRTVIGKEKFEGNDPVAVVLSWLFLFEEDGNKAHEIARQMNCAWESYPFILCDHHELRELIYREHNGEGADLTEQERHGKYIEPRVLRGSEAFKNILRDSAARAEEDAKAPVTQLEAKAREVKKRLALYDRVRSGGQEGRERVHAPGEFGIVALDKFGPTWFSLRGVREYLKNPEVWTEMLSARAIENPAAYEGKPEQPMPRNDLTEIAKASEMVATSYRTGDVGQLAGAADAFFGTLGTVSERFAAYPATATTGLELWFNKANPFRKAWVVSLLAALLLLVSVATFSPWARLSRMFYIAGLLGYAGALVWSAVGFWCRTSISGRPPVSNMYESVIWVGFMTAVFGLVLELIYRKRVLALAGSLVSTFGLVLADQLPLTLAPNIQPLQAVLRSNYWLVIHVLTIVSSYAAFALAWGLGNINLGLMVFRPERTDLVKTLSHWCYRSVQIGVVLLAGGTLLGGFWAAESWGRFWGWDPKEVWALIALLCYVIPLHARYVGWVKDFGLAVCSVVCFASVVMAWYGVNFILGAGLHSYGFGGGNDVWVYWGGLVNVTLVCYAALRYQYQRVEIESA